MTNPTAAWQLLPLSGETQGDLDAATGGLASYLSAHPDCPLVQVAHTLQAAPRHRVMRRFVVARHCGEALQALTPPPGRNMVTGTAREASPKVTFLFPGLGDQYLNMTAELYASNPTFRACVDDFSEAFIPHLGVDLREVIYNGQAASAAPLDLRQMIGRGAPQPDLGRLKETALAQPALFMIEYALAELWRALGIKPAAMAGYSLGEYVVAAQAGVFTLQESLALVALRAQLIAKLPAGAMLAVGLPEQSITAYLNPTVSLSAINGPMMCVVAGTKNAIASLEKRLTADRVACRPVQTTHAFHSYMMRAAAEPLRALLKTFHPGFPQVPYVSNVTGGWIAPAQPTDPEYWVEHMCLPVRFADALQTLWGRPNNVLLEVGLGQTLSGLSMQHPARRTVQHPMVLSSLPGAHAPAADMPSLLRTLGQLWLAGVAVDWLALHGGASPEPPAGLMEELYGQPCGN
jgi:acyl transferase domain-containing protein